MTCLSCYATTTNGLAWCALCQRRAGADLEFLPIYFRNLARWRPGRAGSRPVPSSRVLYDGEPRRSGDRIGDRLDDAANALTTWARAFTKDRGAFFDRPLTLSDAVLVGDISDETAAELSDDEARKVELLCRAFSEHLTSVATLEWAGEFARELNEHEEALSGLTRDLIPGWYAGACPRCETPVYVVPGLTWVTCAGCGATTHAGDHLETILDEARAWVARPMRLAEAAVALIDTEMSVPRLHKRISKWGEREQIEVVRSHDYAPKRFMFGDVLDILLSEGATRLTDEAARVVDVEAS